MARIPEEEVARLKSEISLQRLAEARGVVLRQAVWLGKGERPEVSTQPVSVEADIEATKEEKDES